MEMSYGDAMMRNGGLNKLGKIARYSGTPEGIRESIQTPNV